MKIVTASNGKKTVKMSKIEWQSIGKKAGWNAPYPTHYDQNIAGEFSRELRQFKDFVDGIVNWTLEKDNIEQIKRYMNIYHSKLLELAGGWEGSDGNRTKMYRPVLNQEGFEFRAENTHIHALLESFNQVIKTNKSAESISHLKQSASILSKELQSYLQKIDDGMRS